MINRAADEPWRVSNDVLRSIGLAILMTAMMTPAAVLGHPFHISTAEVEFNSQTGKIEVSLKLHSVDLEQALSRMSGNSVDLELAGNDALIQKYLDGHFYLIPKAQAALLENVDAKQIGEVRSKTRLVGKELKTAWMWLYFEMERPDVPSSYALVNSILLDVAQGQINTVSIRHHAKRNALQMNIKRPWGEIPRAWLTPNSIVEPESQATDEF